MHLVLRHSSFFLVFLSLSGSEDGWQQQPQGLRGEGGGEAQRRGEGGLKEASVELL